LGRSNRRKKSKKSRVESDEGIIRVRLPEEGEVLGQVIQLLGAGLLLVRCTDNFVRQVMIPGRFRKRMWIRNSDVIALLPMYGLNEDEKGTLAYRYSNNEKKILFERELIPEEYIM